MVLQLSTPEHRELKPSLPACGSIKYVFNFFRRPSRLTLGELEAALERLGLDGSQSIIAHSSLRAFGHIEGGAGTVARALRKRVSTLVMPAFSYYTLVWPPEKCSGDWHENLPIASGHFDRFSKVSSDIGRLSQYLVDDLRNMRSKHPALSFVAWGRYAYEVLERQSLENPYGPIGALLDLDGYILLLGVSHTSNTTLHYGEYLAGQVLLPRYVMQDGEVRETYFPNCSGAFDRMAGYLTPVCEVRLERGKISLFKIRDVLEATRSVLVENPEALLCNNSSCRCQEIRHLVRLEGLQPRVHQAVDVKNARALVGKR